MNHTEGHSLLNNVFYFDFFLLLSSKSYILLIIFIWIKGGYIMVTWLVVSSLEFNRAKTSTTLFARRKL